MSFGPSAGATSLDARLSQSIKPFPCKEVEVLFPLDGNETFYAKHGCYTLVPAPTTPGEDGAAVFRSYGGAPSDWSSIFRKDTYDLSLPGHRSGPNAHIVVAKKGDKFTFRLDGDSPVGPPRTLTLIQVTVDSATFLFEPGERMAVIQGGGKLDASIAFDSQVDVSIRVDSIVDSTTIAFRVWFPEQSERIPAVVEETSRLVVAIIAVLGFGGLLLAAARRGHERRGIASVRSDGLWMAM